jgi:protoheme ferro-lyase
MGLYKRGGICRYRFVWNGELIRESTRQTNRRVAQQMGAAHSDFSTARRYVHPQADAGRKWRGG